MAKGLSYADAVVLLGGGPRNRVVAALDRLTGGVLLAASATGAAFPLSLFDAKAELFRLSDELVGSLTYRERRPVSAAHALLALWSSAADGAPPDELADVAETCLRIAMHGFAPSDVETRRNFRMYLLNHLVTIRDNLPDGWVARLGNRVTAESNVDERFELLDLMGRIMGFVDRAPFAGGDQVDG